jgi:hypothetical protein
MWLTFVLRETELDQSKEPEQLVPRLLVFNLILIALVAVGILAWFSFYTDWSSLIGDVLTAGGAFSALAFIFRFLSERRSKQFSSWVSKTIFESENVRKIVLAIVVVGLVAGSFVGTLQVESSRDTIEQAVRIVAPEAQSGISDDISLRSGGQIRKVVLTTWWSPRERKVKVVGYPDQVVSVHSWQRVDVIVPTSLYRPVVLLRTTPDFADELRNNPMQLTVAVGDVHTAVPLEFHGDTVWLGCTGDVDVPVSLQAEWRESLKERPGLLREWLRPKQFDGPELKLKAGDKVIATLTDTATNTKYPTTFTILRLQSVQDFPQEEVLNGPPPHH